MVALSSGDEVQQTEQTVPSHSQHGQRKRGDFECHARHSTPDWHPGLRCAGHIARKRQWELGCKLAAKHGPQTKPRWKPPPLVPHSRSGGTEAASSAASERPQELRNSFRRHPVFVFSRSITMRGHSSLVAPGGSRAFLLLLLAGSQLLAGGTRGVQAAAPAAPASRAPSPSPAAAASKASVAAAAPTPGTQAPFSAPDPRVVSGLPKPIPLPLLLGNAKYRNPQVCCEWGREGEPRMCVFEWEDLKRGMHRWLALGGVGDDAGG